jgi:hypothetical protein
MTPPADFEKRAQLVPNWNSIGMPVHSHGEVDGEDARPESRRAIVVLVTGTEGHGLEHHQQQRQAHGQLRKDVVERNGESEMQPVDC